MRSKTTTGLAMTLAVAWIAATTSCKQSEPPRPAPEPTPSATKPPPEKSPAKKPPKTPGSPATPEAKLATSKALPLPAHWRMVNDVVVPEPKMSKIAANLGGKITALRNTIYDVGGKRVQLNVIDAADAASADKIMARLGRMKSEKALLRHGQRIFEFVGQNDVFAEIVKARDKLADGLK